MQNINVTIIHNYNSNYLQRVLNFHHNLKRKRNRNEIGYYTCKTRDNIIYCKFKNDAKYQFDDNP